MSQAAKAREQDRKARARLRVLHHHEQVTRNVSQTCRGLCAARSSGQQAPGRRVWPPLSSSPSLFPSQALACAAQDAP